jgi:hypothetical protein
VSAVSAVATGTALLLIGALPASGGTGAEPRVRVTVLPSQVAWSAGVEILDNGVVIGNEGTLASVGRTVSIDRDSQPWRWTPGRGMVRLSRGGHPFARAVDSAEPGIVVGEVSALAEPDSVEPYHPARWVGRGFERLLPADQRSARGTAVSRRGDAVVSYRLSAAEGPPPALMLVPRRGAPTDIGTPWANSWKTGLGVNSRREVLFHEWGPDTLMHDVVWRDGTWTRLPGTGSDIAVRNVCSSGPTESGYVAHSYSEPLTDWPPPPSQVLLRTPAGALVRLTDATTSGVIPCGLELGRQAVNERGHVVGYRFDTWQEPLSPRATLWRDGRQIDISGGVDSTALAVNDRDHVLYRDTSGLVLWREGRRTRLPLPTGFDHYEGTGLDDHGRVLGWAATFVTQPGAGMSRAVVWTVPR